MTVVNIRGIRHSVEVQEESLYEADGVALEALKSAKWIEEIGQGTRLEVEVQEPLIRHTPDREAASAIGGKLRNHAG